MDEFDQLSISELNKMSYLKDSDIDYNISLGKKFKDSGNWASAIECAYRALNISNKSIHALELLSELQELQGDLSGALELMNKVKGIHVSPEVYQRIIALYLKNDELSSVMDILNEAIALFPTNEQLLLQKCSLLERLGRIDECLESYQELIKKNHVNLLYKYDYAVFLRNNNRTEDAKKIFSELNNNKIGLPEELNINIRRFLSESDISRHHFRAAARLLIQLGEQMIENEIVALSELIKNSYDAKSPIVEIDVNTEYEERGKKIGKIEIRDQGTGMTKQTIIEHWLLISTNMKYKQKRDKLTEKLPLGEKGIGRLSAHRLGHKLIVETSVKKEAKKTYLEVDWEKFEHNSEISLEDVDVILSEENEEPQLQYTMLKIFKLRNPDFWIQLVSNGKQKSSLQKELSSMISPYKGLQESFNLTIKINGESVQLEMIDEDFLEIISTTKLEYEFFFDETLKEWNAKIITTLYPDFYKLKMKNHMSELQQHEQYWLEKYLNEVNAPGEPKPLNKTLSQQNIIDELKDLWEFQVFGFQSPGPFKMVVYGFSRDTSRKGMVEDKLAEIFGINAKKHISARQYYDIIKGIKIYRDGFRIFPYGEEKNDWLKLDQSATSYGSYDDLKSANTTGYVALTTYNNKLREKTNREGFISDIYSNIFFRLCSNAIKDTNIFIKRELDKIRGIYNKINNELILKIQREKEEKEKQLSNMRKELNLAANEAINTGKSGSSVAATAIKFSEEVNSTLKITDEQNIALKSKIDELLLDFGQITELASMGMLVEAFTHEFEHQGEKLRNLTTTLLKINNKDPQGQKVVMRLISILNILDGYIKYLAPSYQKERKRRVRLDLMALLNMMYNEKNGGFIAQRAKRNKININIRGDNEFVIMGNQGLMTQVFDNLYLNSEYWLKHDEISSYISSKEFNILVDSERKKVFVWDNGRGIDPSIEMTLFDAFESKKPEGEGRGLGLYITKSILELLKVTIFLDVERNNFKRQFKFVLDFSKNGV